MPTKQAPEPNPDEEDQDDYMERCVSELVDSGDAADGDAATTMCANAWQDAMDEQRAAGKPIFKTHADEGHQGLDFILSDATPDRYGDIIMADGWDLDNFKKNPIALFNHNPNFPVGRWEKLHVANGGLRGRLRLAPAGTSNRIDEIRKLVEAGILKAVSVGFRPIESKPRSKAAPGELFVKSELVETSLVSVPANPNALAVAKSLKISPDTLDFVFAKNGNGDVSTRHRGHGENAKPPKRKTQQMSPITKRIEDAQTRITGLKDQLTEHLGQVDDANPDDASTAITEELTGKIDMAEKALDALKKAEAHIAKTAAPAATTHAAGDDVVELRTNRPFAMPAKKLAPSDHLFRSLVVAVKHHAGGKQKTILEVLKDTYGDNDPGEMTRRVMTQFVTRSAVVPADTTTSYWAKELVQTVIGDFIASLMPISIYPQLAAKGRSYTFGRNGTITMPSRDATPTINGTFIAQGAAIPVKKGAFSSISLTPKKMGVITTLTREIAEHSTPSIEGIIRQAILDDTAVALDTILMDNTAASTVRPQGMQNMAGGALGPTSTATLAAFVGDIKLMMADLTSTTKGNIRAPVWIMNPGDVLAASLLPSAAGNDYPFKDELAQGRLMGIPIIQSTTGTTDTMYLVDAADFMTATGDSPRFDVSDQALLHEEDTTPLAIDSGSTTTPVPAAPLRSLWQTDTMAIRMLLDVDWAYARSNIGAWVTSLAWN